MGRRRILWLAVPLLAAAVRSSLLGRPRPELLRDTQWRPTPVAAAGRDRARLDHRRLAAGLLATRRTCGRAHPVLAGLRTRYEGFVDPAVERGSLEVARERAGRRALRRGRVVRRVPRRVAAARSSAETPIVLQGLIEGKWMNRLLGTHAWQPASIGNNVLAVGPGHPHDARRARGRPRRLRRGSRTRARGGGRRAHVTRTRRPAPGTTCSRSSRRCCELGEAARRDRPRRARRSRRPSSTRRAGC